jgi:hypothetical protein
MTSSIYLQVRLKALVSVSCAYDKHYLHKLCLIGVTEKIGKESVIMSDNYLNFPPAFMTTETTPRMKFIFHNS